MSRMSKSLAAIAALMAGGLLASPAFADKGAKKENGVLHVYGNNDAKLFTAEGITRAEGALQGEQFEHGLTVTFDLYAKVPEGKTVPTDEAGKAKFFKNWAVERATADKAKGIYVLVCRSPGYIEVIADKTTRTRGLSNENERQLRDTLLSAFRSARDKPEAEQFKLRDDALVAAVGFIVSDLKDTHVATSAKAKSEAKKSGGMGIGGWICIGLCVLLGVWLVIGLIRAFTGGGGGGGYGGGGGGGGFGSSLLGGLFGAMAGMWLYNSMFGGGGMFGGGSDAYAGDGSGGDAGTSGDGDFSGDDGAGGSFDGGDTGGGGDWGGGGDFGGGDFGGGDF